MEIKPGASIAGLQPEMQKVLKIADQLWLEHGEELVITSGLDGTHSAGSMHYYGLALDKRTRYFNDDTQKAVAHELQARLGDTYKVLLEKDHIHVQTRAFPPRYMVR